MPGDESSTIRKVIRIGLLSRSGQVPARSGLNWGQRPGRNGNEAYIAIPIRHTRDRFFPEIGRSFEVLTDSGDKLTLVRCQQEGKALQSIPRNSILGAYFRRRLGVSSGMPVTRSHLLSYGRTDIEITRVGSSEYHLNFGVRQ